MKARCDGGACRARGFTLIELLIVVAIIAILAAIAVPNFLEAQVRAKISRARADMRTYATALESYAADFNRYPRGYTDHKTMGPFPLGDLYGDPMQNNWELTPLTTPVAYLSGLIVDPFQAAGNKETFFADQQGTPLHYQYQNEKEYFDKLALSPLWAIYGEPAPFRWEMRSLGPDRIRNTGMPGPGCLFSCEQLYDPTNGTMSGGDIVRTDLGDMSQVPLDK